MGNTVLDFNKILKECGVDSEPPDVVLNRISSLDEFYTFDQIVDIYNYILKNYINYDLLAGVIKLSDSHKSSSTMLILIDILLKKCAKLEDIDDYVNLRVLCIKAIANYKDTTTLNILLYCLNNKEENYKIRLTCADALGRIGDKYAVKPLIDVVKDENEKSIYVKESATFALGLLGDISAIEPLVSIMEAKQGLWDKFSFLKEKIVEALGKLNINNTNVLKVFKSSLMDSSPMVRINTIEALMNSEYDEAPELIRKALHDSDEEVQRNALIALFNLQGEDILNEVISLPVYSKFLKEEAEYMLSEYVDNQEEDD